MFTAARVRVAPVAAVPADRRTDRRCVVAATPLRRGAAAWRSSHLRSGLPGSLVVTHAAQEGDDQKETPDERLDETQGRSDEGRLDYENEGNSKMGTNEPKDPSSMVFGRSSKRHAAQCKPPGSVLHDAPAKPSDPAMHRAGKAALVSIAAMFGSVGAARAAQSLNRPSAAGSSSVTASESTAHTPLTTGATDLGMLLADSSDSEEQSAEDKARAKKLAEVRRIKAERAKQLQKRKKAKADDSYTSNESKEGATASGMDGTSGIAGMDGGMAGESRASRRRAQAEEDAANMSPAEKKKAERIAKAKAKAFEEALERERAAAGLDVEEGVLPDVFEEQAAPEQAPVVAAVENKSETKTKKASSKAKKETSSTSKEKKFGLPGGGGGAKNTAVSTSSDDTGDSSNPVTKLVKKMTGPRFTRNVNLRYLRDPFAVKGSSMFPCEMAYTGFYELCEVGRVVRVEYMPNMNSVKFFLHDTDEVFYSNLPYDPTLYPMMLQRGVDIVSRQYGALELFVRSTFNVLTPAILVWFCWSVWQEFANDTTEGATLANTGTAKTYSSTPRTGLTMKDIAGIDVVREEMEELISYLREYERYRKAGAVIPAGVLLCGPPGTGKTLLARCLAGEAQVPFFSCAGTEFMEMFVGVGAARIRNLFKQARDVKPCIVFIDEFDSVAIRRKDPSSQDVSGNDEQVATINQLLTEMDGFGGNAGVMVFAATNRPHVIDPALIRPGRFDRVVEMPLPNRRARCDIIDLHCSYEQFDGMIDPDLNIQFIARQAAGFTGADLENLVRTSALRNASQQKGVPAGDATFLTVIDEIRRSNVFKATGSGTVGETNDVTENALIQQMNPYVRDTVCTYYAAQTLVGMMAPNYDDIAKVRVFANGEETGQIVYVPDEVGADGAASVKRRTWFESKMTVLVAGQMAERYLYGPDKVSQYGILDMKEATAMACEMVMMHGWSDLGPIAVLQDMSAEEKYLKAGKQKGQNKVDAGRNRGKLWGAPDGKADDLQGARSRSKQQNEDAQMLLLGISDELDLLIANEVRKIFVKACQRAVMIMHDPKGTEMLFTLREALATAKEINGLNLHMVFDKFGLVKHRDFNLVDLDWGKEYELYWDEFVNHIWADDANNTGFWKLVQEQWRHTVVEPTMYEREVQKEKREGDSSSSSKEPVKPDLPEWAREYVRSLNVGAREEMLMYAPKDVQDRIRDGAPALYDGPGFGKRDIRTERDFENPQSKKE